ncbi:hypothetical protein ACP70R_026024 [Stipagrostis hirtigluma subsp. patula]
MAADNFHKDCAPATVQGPEGAIDGELDRLSGLPDDILLDILGRLVAVGDVRTVATTSSLSRRWRSLPWPQIPQVLLDVGHFFSRSDSDEWVRARRRHRFGDQHHAMAAFTGALARLLSLAAPPSKRFIERLALKFILTRRDYMRRIGELVGAAAAAGTASNIEFEIVTEMTCTSSNDHPSMISYGERFTGFVRDCPGAFRSLTKLAVQFLWFEDQDALRNLVRGCGALEFLSLEFCGLLRPPAPDTDLTLAAALTIDAPESRLRTLVCDYCFIRRVELVHAPALVEFHHRWIFDDFSPPISCGCAPSLKTLSLTHLYGKDGLDIDVTWKLSELLVNVDKIETLRFDFENEKVQNTVDRCIYIKDMGEASYVIGIEIFRDREQGLLGLSQKSYINKILERFRMENCSMGVVPIQKGDKFSLMQCPKNDLERKEMESVPYASIVGSLMYASTCTRPDISFAVGMLGRYQSNPGKDHWVAAKKVLRYLQGTKDYMLTYKRSSHLEIIGYSDSDYAGCVDPRKSTFGYVFLLAGGAVSWKSGKQSVIATSTMEAEFVACFEATIQALWLRNFISGIHIMDNIERPLKIYCDNSAAVFFSKNDKYSKGAKHMDLKYLSVKEEVQKKRVSIEHIGTALMVADPLTKGLPPKTFIGHVERMGIINKTLLD